MAVSGGVAVTWLPWDFFLVLLGSGTPYDTVLMVMKKSPTQQRFLFSPFPSSPPPQYCGLAFFLLWWEERSMAGVGKEQRATWSFAFTWCWISSRHLLLAQQYRNSMDSSVGGISFFSIKLISILPRWWGMRNCWTCCPSDEIKGHLH